MNNMNDINWRTPNDYDTQTILDSYSEVGWMAIVQMDDETSFIVKVKELELRDGKLVIFNFGSILHGMEIARFALI